MSDRGNNKKVLVVLNDAHTRMTVRTTLERAGFVLEFEEDGEEALLACRRSRPDALVVGSRLKKMDGFVFLYKLKGDGLASVIPAVLIAEDSERARERMALARGARAFLTKPVKVRKLLEHVTVLSRGDARILDSKHREQVTKLAEQDERNAQRSQKPERQQPRPVRTANRPANGVTRQAKPLVNKQSPRHQLLNKLREEVRRLKSLPYHKRLELDLEPAGEDVDIAFRRIAMKYHPDRYKHHGKDARRLAQGVFMLLNDAKRALKPKREAPAPPAKESAAAEPSDSWRRLPPKREEMPRSQNTWTPAAIDLSDIPVPPDSSDEGRDEVAGAAVPSDSDSAIRDSDSAIRDSDNAIRDSGEHIVDDATDEDDPAFKMRRIALAALAEGRYRDAKNQIGRLLDALDDDETDDELMLSDKLARGHLRWEEGYLEEALELFEDALEIDKECAGALRAIVELKEVLDKQSSGLFNRLLGKR